MAGYIEIKCPQYDCENGMLQRHSWDVGVIVHCPRCNGTGKIRVWSLVAEPEGQATQSDQDPELSLYYMQGAVVAWAYWEMGRAYGYGRVGDDFWAHLGISFGIMFAFSVLAVRFYSFLGAPIFIAAVTALDYVYLRWTPYRHDPTILFAILVIPYSYPFRLLAQRYPVLNNVIRVMPTLFLFLVGGYLFYVISNWGDRY